jgi:predicted permease
MRRWISKVALRLRSLLRRSRVEQDLSDELRFHLENLAKEKIAQGMTPDEARYAALRELGGVEQIKEECRDMRRVNFFEDLLRDLGYALRQLHRNPGFTTIAALTLALGIGANTAIYSLAYSVLLRELPVKNPQRLVLITAAFGKWPAGYSMNGGDPGSTFSFPAFRALSAERQVFASVFAFAPPDIGKENLTIGVNGRATTANGVMVTGAYFSGLGVIPALGRVISPPDERRPAPRVADISFGYWAREFGKDPAVIGKRLAINRTDFTIVGVLQPGFTGADPGNVPDVWIPITANGNLGPWGGMPASITFGRGSFAWMTVMGRLKAGVSRRQAAAAATLVFERNLETSLGRQLRPGERPRIELSPGGGGLDSLRNAFSEPLIILMALAGFLLLLAAANVAGLLIARGAARQGEIALRAALGAGRGRLIRQLLTEGIMLAALGGAAALALAKWGSHVLAALLASGREEITIQAGLGGHVLIFMGVVSLLVGVLVGIVPAVRGTAADPISALKSAGTLRGSWGRVRRPGWGNGLVVAQIALAVLLLAAAGLFLRTLENVEAENTGINPRHLLLFGINPIGYSDRQSTALYQQLLERIRALPGVESGSVSQFTMMSGWRTTGEVSIVGYHSRPGQNMGVSYLSVGPRFFRTVGIPRLAGRSIETRDIGEKPKAAVVNQEFARRFFGRSSPIGQIIKWDGAQTPIVGVVKDAKYDNPFRKPPATIYLPTGAGYFEVRTHGDPMSLVPAIRRVVSTMAPGVPLSGVESEVHEVRGWFMQQRLLASLGGFFGLLGLLLSALGAYGLISFRVAQRTHEIGIRMALGAKKGDVLKMVAAQGLRLTLIGVAIGIGCAFALTRFLSSLLYGIKPTDPLTFIAVSLILLGVALLASCIPARRAAKVDPMIALRDE